MAYRRDGNFDLRRPRLPCGTGVLVLAGSSGAMDTERAELFASHGAMAMAMRWFGGEGQPETPSEVPLESFIDALADLAADVDRLAIVGSSFGAEAALCVASRHPVVDAVVALAPSAYVWPGPGSGGAMRSHWTWGGEPLDFVPLDDSWEASGDPPAYRSWYAQSLVADPAAAAAATIPVEDFGGELVLVAGGDDQVWPSAEWSRQIDRRRAKVGLSTVVVAESAAGHRVVFPGEQPVSRGRAMIRGGTTTADASLGQAAWPHIVDALRLNIDAA